MLLTKGHQGRKLFYVQDRYRFAVGDSADAEDCYEFPIEVSDGKVQSYFERENTDLEVSVAQLFEQMEKHESELSHPPSEGLDAAPLLIKLKVNTPFSEFSRAINENVDLLLEERFTENVKTFIDIMWFHSFVAIENHIIENPDDLDIKVTRDDFTTVLLQASFIKYLTRKNFLYMYRVYLTFLLV